MLTPLGWRPQGRTSRSAQPTARRAVRSHGVAERAATTTVVPERLMRILNHTNATPSVTVVVIGSSTDLSMTNVVGLWVKSDHNVTEKLSVLVNAHHSETSRKKRWITGLARVESSSGQKSKARRSADRNRHQEGCGHHRGGDRGLQEVHDGASGGERGHRAAQQCEGAEPQQARDALAARRPHPDREQRPGQCPQHGWPGAAELQNTHEDRGGDQLALDDVRDSVASDIAPVEDGQGIRKMHEKRLCETSIFWPDQVSGRRRRSRRG